MPSCKIDRKMYRRRPEVLDAADLLVTTVEERLAQAVVLGLDLELFRFNFSDEPSQNY